MYLKTTTTRGIQGIWKTSRRQKPEKQILQPEDMQPGEVDMNPEEICLKTSQQTPEDSTLDGQMAEDEAKGPEHIIPESNCQRPPQEEPHQRKTEPVPRNVQQPRRKNQKILAYWRTGKANLQESGQNQQEAGREWQNRETKKQIVRLER